MSKFAHWLHNIYLPLLHILPWASVCASYSHITFSWGTFSCLQLRQRPYTWHLHNKIFAFIFWCVVCFVIIIIIIKPLTVRVVGAPRWFCNQFSPFFPVLHCPLGLAELQACPFPDVVFPPLPLSALSSSPFHPALHDHTTAVFVSLRWSGGLHVVRMPPGSWHGLPRW